MLTICTPKQCPICGKRVKESIKNVNDFGLYFVLKNLSIMSVNICDSCKNNIEPEQAQLYFYSDIATQLLQVLTCGFDPLAFDDIRMREYFTYFYSYDKARSFVHEKQSTAK